MMINELITSFMDYGISVINYLDNFLINEDFAKSLIAEGIGIVVEVILITIIIAKAMISRKKKNFKIFILPLINNFITTHNNYKNIITNLSDELYISTKCWSWNKSILENIEELNNLNIYEHYPELSRELLEYSLILKQTKRCITEKRFDKDIYDEIFKLAEDISQSFIDNELSKENIILDTVFIQSFKKELMDYDFK